MEALSGWDIVLDAEGEALMGEVVGSELDWELDPDGGLDLFWG